MNMLLNVFSILYSPHIKTFTKVFFLFLLVASFLASCVTDDSAGIIGSSTLTLDDCPTDRIEFFVDATGMSTVEWINLAREDIIITSIGIEATGDTVNDNLPELALDSTSAILSTGTYTVTISAESILDPLVTGICSFSVTVSPPGFTANCLTTLVSITLRVGEVSRTLSDEPSITITTANNDGTSTITYSPDTITEDNVGNFVTVIATATDDSTAATATCTFTVDVTQNIGSSTLTDTTITCSDTSITLDIDGTPIDLASAITSGITASNSDTDITSPNLIIYDPATLSVAGTYPVRVTVEDDMGAIALLDGTEAECMFSFTVEPAPDPIFSTCPTTVNGETVENMPVTWEQPVLMNLPTTATISDPAIIPEGATSITSTGATFTAANTYTVTFTAMNGSETIMVGEAALTCTFKITIAAMTKPENSVFFLATHETVPDPDNPFLIRDTNDLLNFARVVNDNEMYMNINKSDNNPAPYRTAAYRLANNISFDASTENNFTPIGTGMMSGTDVICNDICFEGTFDGGSNTISGLYFNDSTRDHLGFFAVISNASIRNLILTNANITGNSNVGGLVGVILTDSSISNVFATGTVSASKHVGGLIGEINNSSITNAAASVDVDITTSIGGGLVGRMRDSSLTNTFASGAVKGTRLLGGLVGAMQSNSSITNAYASGPVGTFRTGVFIGGLVSSICNDCSLLNTVAWGSVLGDSDLGGLISIASTPTVTASYWDNTFNGTRQATSAGDRGTGKMTVQLQIAGGSSSIYSNWNTIDHRDLDLDEDGKSDISWAFSRGWYPVLHGLLISVACQLSPTHSSCSQ